MGYNAGDILRVTAKQRLFGEQVLNVFFYEIREPVDAQSNLFEFAESWSAYYGQEILTRLSDALTLESVLVENLTDGVDFSENSTVRTGNVAGDCMPRFVAYGIQQVRASKLTRNGFKRFAGVPESAVTDGNVTIPTTSQEFFTNFCGGISIIDDLNSPSKQYNVQNVIVGRTLVGGSYQLDLTKINPINSAIFKQQVTTQNSRKS